MQVDISLINNINNETTMLWQAIKKASTSTISEAEAKIGNDIAGNYNSIQLYLTQEGVEFFLTLFNDIKSLIRSQQLDFIKRELSMSISRLMLAT